MKRKESGADKAKNDPAKDSSQPPPEKTSSQKPKEEKDFLVVGIGASAGGIKALREFFSLMPDDSGMAFVVVLHLSQTHESNLAQILQRQTEMPVEQITETVKVEPNRVYVIPPAKHLEMVDGVIRPKEPERVRGKRVPIDRFFRTMAEAYERKAVCIIMSGTGSDGTLGLKHIKERNGFAIVQDPKDADYDGMPRSAIATKIADVVLPVSKMPEKLLFVRDSTERMHLADGKEAEVAREIKNIELLRDVLTVLRVRTGHDFTNYKRPTLIRRIARHLQIHNTDDLQAYLEILRENPEEVLSLLKNLLINVTNFFRDKEAFEVLEKQIIPRLFWDKTSEDQVRVWVAGCASGEEAYSMAILLSEHAANLPAPPKIQIFASDVDEEAIAEAREGRYTEAIVSDVSPERLRQYFVKENKHYRIRKSIREMILFAPHNILRDPPFSRLDMVSCRNVLIYLNRETQERVLQIFHFALRERGYLFLGSSESAESVPQNFAAFDKKHRIYQYQPSSATWNQPPQMPLHGAWRARIPELTVETRRNLQSFGELHHRLIEQYAPPSILVNEENDILHLSEHAGRFLRFIGGEPTSNLLKVIHPALLSDIRAALFAARQEDKTVEVKNIRLINGESNALVEHLNLIVRPIKIPENFVLVIFEESHNKRSSEKEAVQSLVTGDAAMESVVRQLEDELQQTKERLRYTIEQYETTVEEHKAANEEMQAVNEELRSASEELETGKEELQSVNEELTTVNHELKNKIDEVSTANSDLLNLMRSTDIATIFLDRSLRVKRYTPRATEIFNLIPTDIGRPLEHITHHLLSDSFQRDAARVLQKRQSVEHEVRSKECVYLARFLPYYTLDDRIDGVVLTFIDITERKKNEIALRESEEQFRVFVKAISEIVYEMSADWSEMRFLRGKDFIATTENPRRDWMDEYIPDDEKERVWAAIKQAIKKKGNFEMEHRILRLDGDIGWTFSRAIPILDAHGKITRWFGAASDITKRKHAEEALRASEEKFRSLFEAIEEGFCIIEVLFDDAGEPSDYRFLETNRWFEKQTGLADAAGKTMRELAPTHEQHWFDIYGRIARTGESARFENEAKALGFFYDVYAFRVGAPDEHRVAVLFHDITERKRREANLTFLDGLQTDLANLSTIEEITQTAGRRIKEYLKLSHCLFVEIDETAAIARVFYDSRDGAPGNLVGDYTLSDFHSAAEREQLMRGASVVINHVRDGREPAAAAAFEALGIRSLLTVSYRSGGRWKFALSAQDEQPREWRADEAELLHEIAARLYPRLERARTEAALRESEERMSAIVSQTTAGIAQTDADGTLSFVKEKYCAILGASRDEVIGTKMQDWTHPDDLPGNLALFSRLTETGEPFDIEKRYVRPDNSIVWVHNSVSAVRGEGGEIRQLVAVSVDITTRKRAEQALRESEEKFRTLFETIDEGFCIFEVITDDSGRVTDILYREANDAFERHSGLRDVIGKMSSELHPNVKQELFDVMGRILETGEPVRGERFGEDLDRWFSFYYSRVGGEGSNLIAAVIDDITARKRRELNTALLDEIGKDLSILSAPDEIMQTVGARLGEFLELSGCYFVDVDEAKNEVTVHYGWASEQSPSLMQTFKLEDYLSADFLRTMCARAVFVMRDTAHDERADAQNYARLKIGSFVTVPFFRNGRYVAHIAVTTEQKHDWQSQEIQLLQEISARIFPRIERARVEEALRESEERLQLAAKTSGFGFHDFNLETGQLYWAPELLEMHGLPPDAKVSFEMIEDFLHPEDRQRISEEMRKTLDPRGTGEFEREFRIIRHDTGETRWIYNKSQTYFSGKGRNRKAVRNTGIVIDITTRKHAEQALRESEERLRIAVEAAELGTWDWNLQTDEIIWNERHFTIFGMKPSNTPQTPESFFRHVYEEDREWLAERLTRAIKTNTTFDAEFRIVRVDGAIRWMEGYGHIVEYFDGKPARMSGVMSDITVRKRSEESVRQSEERLRLIMQSITDYAIITTDQEGIINGWNTGAERTFGYPASEAVGKPCAIIFTPEDRAAGIPQKEIENALKNGYAEDLRWHIRRDGSRFFASGMTTPIKDGEVEGFVKITSDQTERLEAEKSMREKEMLQKLVGAQEDERKRIARDLHDELGQQLTALRLKLENSREICQDETVCDEIDKMQAIARQIDEGIDFLAWELRPAALEKYLREWTHYSGVASELLTSNIKTKRFAPETEINLYRIAQEAMNNIHKHARAGRVEVALKKRDDLIILIIEDDGIGFNAEEEMPEKCIGIIGMKERAMLIGGTLEIESAHGKGTTIYARVPVKIS